MRYRKPPSLALAVTMIIIPSGSYAHPNRTVAAAEALTGHYESIFYAEAALVSAPRPDDRVDTQTTKMLGLPFAKLVGEFDRLGTDASKALFLDAEAVMVGARDFRAPVKLGDVRSSYCYIIILGSNRFMLGKYLGPGRPFDGGIQVWERPSTPTEGDPAPSPFYLTQFDAYVLVSNGLDDLQAVSKRLHAAVAGPHQNPQLREWERVAPHEFWGYRVYRHSAVLDRAAAGMQDISDRTEALIFTVDSKRGAGVLTLICSPKDERTPAALNARRHLPPFKSTALGTWQSSFSLLMNEQLSEHLLAVMEMFGFGVYL